MIDYAVDENVQIHGGNGFVRDYAAERMYRTPGSIASSGTNEITAADSRDVDPAGAQGQPAADSRGQKLQDEILTPSPAEPASDEPLEHAKRTVASLRKVGLGARHRRATYGDKLTEQQELTLAADIIIDVRGRKRAAARVAPVAFIDRRRGGRGVHCGCGRTRRDCGAHGAGGDDRRRQPADAVGRSPSAAQAHADQHGDAATADR